MTSNHIHLLRHEYNYLITRIFDMTARRDKARMQFTKLELQEEIYKAQKRARSIDQQINERITLASHHIEND